MRLSCRGKERPLDRLVTVRIDSLAFGGSGVARLASGKVAFVPRTAPGDVVKARIAKSLASHDELVVESLLEESKDRVEPACKEAGRCGGCSWIHLSIRVQRRWKRQLLARELLRAGLVEDEEQVPAVQGGAPLGYRIRTRIHLRGRRFGTMERRSNRVVPLSACPILTADLEELAGDTAKALAETPPATAEADLELYIDSRGRRGLSVEPRGDDRPEAFSGLEAKLGLASLRIARRHRVEDRTPPAALWEKSRDVQLLFEPGVFVQANREMNQNLVAEVLEAAGEPKSFVDVYAGVGNFTVHLAKNGAAGEAVEAHPRAATLLQKNLGAVGSSTVEIHAERASRAASRLATEAPAELLIADPPRAGMKGLAPLFESRAAPQRVVVVSCHPMAAIRDMKHLVSCGYHLERLALIDMFPQTHHLELVAAMAQ